MKVTLKKYNEDGNYNEAGDKIIHVDWLNLTPEHMTFSPSYRRTDDTNSYSFAVPIVYPLGLFIETEYDDESISVDVELMEEVSHVIYPTVMYTNINDHIKEFFNKYADDYNLDYCVTSVGLDIQYSDSLFAVKWDCTTSALIPEVTMKIGNCTYSNNHSGVVELDNFINGGQLDVKLPTHKHICFKDEHRVCTEFKSIDEFESIYNAGLSIDNELDDAFRGFEIRISNK